jgi:hypothetical protein
MLGARDEAPLNAAYADLTKGEPASARSPPSTRRHCMTLKLKRTLALALAGGSLAIGVPAALAAGGGDDPGSTSTPSTFIQEEQQAPENARPDRDDCPEKDGAQGGGGEQQGGSAADGAATETPAL